MASCTARWRGLDEFKKKLDPEPVVKDLIQELAEEADRAWSRVVDLTPRSVPGLGEVGNSPHTAELWERPKLRRENGRIIFVIDHPYNEPGARAPNGTVVNDGMRWSLLRALEHGTANHWIRPKQEGGWLTFWKKSENKWIRTHEVHHPGTRAYAMVRRAKVESQMRLDDVVLEVLERHGLA